MRAPWGVRYVLNGGFGWGSVGASLYRILIKISPVGSLGTIFTEIRAPFAYQS